MWYSNTDEEYVQAHFNLLMEFARNVYLFDHR